MPIDVSTHIFYFSLFVPAMENSVPVKTLTIQKQENSFHFVIKNHPQGKRECDKSSISRSMYIRRCASAKIDNSSVLFIFVSSSLPRALVKNRHKCATNEQIIK